MSVSLIRQSRILNCVPDLGTCCTSNAINQWSFFKPINHDSASQLTTQNFYDNDDGFNLYTYSSMATMLYELQHPEIYHIWRYEDREEPYRLTDFDGYVHSATPLCELTWNNNNAGPTGSMIRLYCTDFEDILAHWHYFSGHRQNIDLVLIFYPYGTQFNQGGTTGFYVYKVCNMVDYDGGGDINFTIPPSLTSGQYEIRLCLSNATDSMDTGPNHVHYWNQSNPLYGTTWALPHHTKNIFTVMQSGGGGSSQDFSNYILHNFSGLDFTFNDPYLTGLTFKDVVTIGSTNDLFNVSIDYYYSNTLNGDLLLQHIYATLSQEDIAWRTVIVDHPQAIETASEAHLPDGIITIKTVMNITNVKTGVSQNNIIQQHMIEM